jgi:hypothetical protein
MSHKAWPLRSTKCNRPFAAPGNSKGSGDSLDRVLLVNTFSWTGVLTVTRRLLKGGRMKTGDKRSTCKSS